MSADLDVIVVGAGVAGLAALAELDRAGVNANCVEARDRIGGRVYTLHDPLCPLPIELGAEFIHGRPPEIWNIVQSAALAAYNCTEHAVHIDAGRVQDRKEAWLLVDEVMQDMQQAAKNGPDQPFAIFLAKTSHAANAKQLATSYVEGFNAARAEVVGIASLAKDAQAADSIDGDRAFRIWNGYDSIPLHLLRCITDAGRKLRLNTVVESISWERHKASVLVRSKLTGELSVLRAKQVIVTAPLGVLQAGAIRFDPEPAQVLEAARQLRFGQVIRIVFRFRERIWEKNAELAEVGFLLSNEPVFPTWWTPLPVRAPILTGWSSGPKADALLGLSPQDLIDRGLQHLCRVTGIDEAQLRSSLETAYFHDWAEDPFARGAYSYVPADAMDARDRLATPVEDTLFFAGEASETTGHSATVHGAIMSGRRAALDVEKYLAS